MENITEIKNIISQANRILIIQADNPDADSLASALALESILHSMKKEPLLYCGIDMPQYLRYLPGWDRVESQIPKQFDASIIVDTSAKSLLDQLSQSGSESWVASKPVIVLDHHADVQCDIDYASIILNDSSKVSTGELIYDIAKRLDWPMPIESLEYIMTSILADSMGLTTENTSANTYKVMTELVELGADRPKLEEQRRAYNKMEKEIFRYKGRLIERTEIIDDKIALLVIPQDEINTYSPLYNPAPLIQPDHLQTRGVLISVVLKSYDSGRVTGAIRCNYGTPIASKLAKTLGGGGHTYASGFKTENRNINDIKQSVIEKIQELLNEDI